METTRGEKPMIDLKSKLLRRPGAWLMAGTMLALTSSLTGCFGSDSGGGGGYVYICTGPADTLCVDRTTLLDTGVVLYEGNCTGCHNNGYGSAGGVPPHINADFVQKDKNKRLLIEILLAGYSDSIKVNGLWYSGGMPSFMDSYSNMEVAGILTYIRVALNDSTVGKCDAKNLDSLGFATCKKTPRSDSERAADSVAVWEVKVVRDSILANLPM
jgi:hypothetical protein